MKVVRYVALGTLTFCSWAGGEDIIIITIITIMIVIHSFYESSKSTVPLTGTKQECAQL
jgi:hypothetical protein